MECPDLTIRCRVPADLPAVARLLRASHESDGYPIVLPDDLERWGAADDVFAAWVAVTDGDEVVGHVVLTEIDALPGVGPGHPGSASEQWLSATGRPASQLAAVRRLVVGSRAKGRGLGRRLLDTAVDAAYALHRRPVLDMSSNLSAAARLYASAGFTHVGNYDLHLRGHHLDVLTFIGPDILAVGG